MQEKKDWEKRSSEWKYAIPLVVLFMKEYPVKCDIRFTREQDDYLDFLEQLHGFSRSDAVRYVIEYHRTRERMKEQEVRDKLEELTHCLEVIDETTKVKIRRIDREIEGLEEKKWEIIQNAEFGKKEILQRRKVIQKFIDGKESFASGERETIEERILAQPWLWTNRHNDGWIDGPAGKDALRKLNISKYDFRNEVKRIGMLIGQRTIEIITETGGEAYKIIKDTRGGECQTD